MTQQLSFTIKFTHIPDDETLSRAARLLRRATNNDEAEEITLTIKATATIPDETDVLPSQYQLLPGDQR